MNLLCQKDGKIAELEACILKLLTHIKHCLNTNVIAASANEKSLADMSTKLMGGDKEIRTLDPLLAKQVLYQLSYTPDCDCKYMKFFWIQTFILNKIVFYPFFVNL